jgi:hypothetical protein
VKGVNVGETVTRESYRGIMSGDIKQRIAKSLFYGMMGTPSAQGYNARKVMMAVAYLVELAWQ